jgi:hypothetical protein
MIYENTGHIFYCYIAYTNNSEEGEVFYLCGTGMYRRIHPVVCTMGVFYG